MSVFQRIIRLVTKPRAAVAETSKVNQHVKKFKDPFDMDNIVEIKIIMRNKDKFPDEHYNCEASYEAIINVKNDHATGKKVIEVDSAEAMSQQLEQFMLDIESQ